MTWVFALGLFIMVLGILIISLSDLVALLVLGSKSTLSHYISTWVGGNSAGQVWLVTFIASASFVLGMLVTHFLNFRM